MEKQGQWVTIFFLNRVYNTALIRDTVYEMVEIGEFRPTWMVNAVTDETDNECSGVWYAVSDKATRDDANTDNLAKAFLAERFTASDTYSIVCPLYPPTLVCPIR